MQVPVNSKRGRVLITLVSHRLNDPSLDILKSDWDFKKAVTEEGWVKESKCLQFSQLYSLHACSQGCMEVWYFQVCDASPLLWMLQKCYGRTRGFPLYGGCGVSNRSAAEVIMTWAEPSREHSTVHVWLCTYLKPPCAALSCLSASMKHKRINSNPSLHYQALTDPICMPCGVMAAELCYLAFKNALRFRVSL